ncbi:MAG: ubiquinol oxidase subunit II [Candidatus Cohnella colombiensis]|uniref:Quinol oxidase subunit 2 n=1 Tax=Candidatus Cohnella colombiensis TaxID=3121368 RepID=A0AA95EZ31_9BACL|nr:MAG: ubiquinol oxidase subunit II [Cohnella sp.]
MKRGFRRLTTLLSLGVMTLLLSGCSNDIIVLNPKGEIAKHQMDLIYITTGLCLLIILPVLILTFFIVWRYRNRPDSKAKYKPEWEHNTKLEVVWWTIPVIIIILIGIVTVQYTYKLEPSKPLEHEADPIVIQVTSLDWKWLFQYPDQDIATVNYVQFPEDVPIRFELTSDAPMNSFWIPQLGGQIYTMSGMAMTLHLIADEPGEYLGSGANFSGKDFAKMQFVANATSQEEFDQWVEQIKATSPELTDEGYQALAEPGVSEKVTYSGLPENLFERTVAKYGSKHNHGSVEHDEQTHDEQERG